jgi:hypothetical protein
MDKYAEDRMVQQIEKNLSGHLQEMEEQPIVSFDYSNPISISRAEYIRQAREACLRQLSEVQNTARAYDSYYVGTYPQSVEPVKEPKKKTTGLFHEGITYDRPARVESTQDILAFRFLMLRTVCAIALFLCLFLIDRFDFPIGNMGSEKIQEYITGNDTLDTLENLLVTWLKD